jgi:hypothetical protein
VQGKSPQSRAPSRQIPCIIDPEIIQVPFIGRAIHPFAKVDVNSEVQKHRIIRLLARIDPSALGAGQTPLFKGALRGFKGATPRAYTQWGRRCLSAGGHLPEPRGERRALGRIQSARTPARMRYYNRRVAPGVLGRMAGYCVGGGVSDGKAWTAVARFSVEPN